MVTDIPRIARLAAVQAAPVYMDREATIDKACQIIAEASANGADIIGFPENFIPGHPSWYYFDTVGSEWTLGYVTRLFRESVDLEGDELAPVAQAARRYGVNVVMGLTERRPGTSGTLFNTQVFIDSAGVVLGKHQKLMPTGCERMVHAAGTAETQVTFASEFGTISSLVCGENSNPLAVARINADYPFVHVASWPNVFSQHSAGMRQNSLLASRNIAYMCGCFVIASCSINSSEMVDELGKTDEDRAFLANPENMGGAAVIDPAGQVLAGPLPGDVEDIAYADADFDLCIRAKAMHDHAGHYNRPDVYQLRVHTDVGPLVSTNDGRVPQPGDVSADERETADDASSRSSRGGGTREAAPSER